MEYHYVNFYIGIKIIMVPLTELDVVKKINSLRKKNTGFICPSFPTIRRSWKKWSNYTLSTK